MSPSLVSGLPVARCWEFFLTIGSISLSATFRLWKVAAGYLIAMGSVLHSEPCAVRSFKNRREFCQDVISDRVGHAFEAPGAARIEIERAGLVAMDDTWGFISRAHKAYRETNHTDKIAAASDRQNDGKTGDVVEGFSATR